MKMDKTGWIRIVEAFVAILLITGVLLTVLNKGYIEKDDISSKIYKIENSILREIQLNDTLRNQTLRAGPLPVEWANFDSPGLINIKYKIQNRTPNYLGCEAKICEINDLCISHLYQDEDIYEDVYAQAVIISADIETYSPRQLKLFCWME